MLSLKYRTLFLRGGQKITPGPGFFSLASWDEKKEGPQLRGLRERERKSNFTPKKREKRLKREAEEREINNCCRLPARRPLDREEETRVYRALKDRDGLFSGWNAGIILVFLL